MNLKKQKGVAVVEFAIVLPVLLLTFVGIVEFGLALYDKAVITNASREGARAGIVLQSTKLPLTGTPSITSVVTNYMSTYMVTFGSPTSTNVQVTATGVQGTFGQPLTVNVSYTYTGLLLGKMINALTGPITLTATTTMNNE